MSTNGTDVTGAVKDTIYKACVLLDRQKWNEWLDLCAEDFRYSIKAYSPEIRYDMTYYTSDRKGLAAMVAMLPKHNSDHSPLKRHATVYSVDVDEDGKTATAETSLVVYQTLFDGINSHVDAGESRLFLVGNYVDRFRIDGGTPKFVEREVRLETRRLDKGSHWPI
jgi:methanesulfonate monooxygenase small subunit